MKKIFRFFDKLEDRTREHLSRVPIFYAVVGGVAVVLFWRGVWHSADMLEASGGIWAALFSAPFSMVVSTIVLLLTGLFVSFFIGDRIILSGLRHEKKIEEKTEEEVREEEAMLATLNARLDFLSREIAEIKTLVKK